MSSASSLDSFDNFTSTFTKTFSHQPCIVIGVTQSNLPPSPWSGKDNLNAQLCCQPFFDPDSNGGRYEIAFYDNGYAYYETLEGSSLQGRLERMNPQMEFRDLRKVLEKMKQIFEQSVTKKADNQISVQLINDDLLLVDIKGLINGSILFKYMFKCLRREGEFYETNYVRQIVYCLAERKSRELELIKLIQAKDKELDDYRSQGTCQLQRAWLATQPFEKEEFDKSTSRQVQQRHDDVLMHTLDLAFDREGQQLIEECLLRNEYLKRSKSSKVSSNSSGSSTKKNASPQKRALVKTNSGSSQSLNDDAVATERRRHEELEKQLKLAKERDEQIAKKKKKKFV
ncbi:unnamed protein product [Rotaria socialis]|uniref:Non-homologous end-joining factor 1 n=1 Tax=Rotaria socialis TaxID=392032 RepID=A0A820Q0Y7_9BILA|nr:unnamed protein product [Rotaria socialis]CAF3290904.1 unnamed protein product [Rotaria socialis]CAF3408683.1 unnamed protein product [Rotaria socialis]CAF3566008.1 unnamed protein product [Rotaria socialis]CAF3733128.1 unnamed protein product [Rotaria socialis]